MTKKHEPYPDAYHDAYAKTIFGFWIYILTDFILFGTLFATYAVLHNNVFGGPSARELFSLPFVFIQTLVLLVCSYTVGMAGAAAHRRDKKLTYLFFGITFLLGVVFTWMGIADFSRLIQAGHDWRGSAFLGAYFTLVGTHTLHMVFALLWIPIFLIPMWKEGLDPVNIRRLTCLKMFWQFLNIVWVFIFSFVYLMGAI